MSRTAHNTAVAVAPRAVITRRPVAGAVAPAPTLNRPALCASPVVVSIDGAAEPCGRADISSSNARGLFASTVIASLLCLVTGAAQADLVSIEPAGAGCYVADFACLDDAGDVYGYPVTFGTADATAADAPAPRPVTPQVPALPGMSPLGLADTRPVKRLPAPAVAAALKAGSAAASAASAIVRVRVTFENGGSFDVRTSRAELAEPAAFARLYVAPRASAYHEWPRCGVDYASRIGADGYSGAVSHNGKRQIASWGIVSADTPAPAVLLPERRGMGGASRPATGVDALAARMGRQPAGSAVAQAEARAKAAGVKLSRQERSLAEATDAAAVRSAAPGRTVGGHAVEAAPRMSAGTRAIFDAAREGKVPVAPDFSAETHTRYRPRLAELVKLVKAGDVAALRAFVINPISTSPKALDRYRNAAVIALEVRAARKAAKIAA